MQSILPVANTETNLKQKEVITVIPAEMNTSSTGVSKEKTFANSSNDFLLPRKEITKTNLKFGQKIERAIASEAVKIFLEKGIRLQRLYKREPVSNHHGVENLHGWALFWTYILVIVLGVLVGLLLVLVKK